MVEIGDILFSLGLVAFGLSVGYVYRNYSAGKTKSEDEIIELRKKLQASASVTKVPPFSTNALSASTPSLPIPLRYSGGTVELGLRDLEPGVVSAVILPVESLGRMITSYFFIRFPFLISASIRDV